ncbi:clostripain-related cysteine peptidase [Bacteroides caecicola]|uniref:clostripain-related cysteine peptidase n=1 Tax=Bacteroides caecicola TaxID=1462569 RepID=UPI002011108B|nr:clostripain-related cysteine peptidase [Bacteroides caecicola]MCL1625584.1 clostripain-related cysteine peptidase [Bacteroides caecicola]
MKRLLYLCVTIAMLASCSNEIPEQEEASFNGRTILVYLVANNSATNLDRYLKTNILWMYQNMATDSDSCRLLVYYRPNQNDGLLTEPSILEFISDGKGHINGRSALSTEEFSDVFGEATVLRTYIETEGYNATDPEVMAQVFRDMQTAAPSNSYGLIFGSHASGWMPASATVSRAFGDDDGYSINIPELRDVLTNSFASGNLDFILLDACMMGSVEVAYELRNVADYCIASVMETPASGFPYQRMFHYLSDTDVDYQRICTAFTDYYQSGWGTCAAIDCSRLDNLVDAVAGELQNHAADISTLDYQNIQQYGANSYRNFSFDIGDFFRQLNGGTIPASIQTALDQAVIAKSCIPGKYSYLPEVDADRFCGIGMFFPEYTGVRSSWEDYYRTSISWYQAVGWDGLLN